MNPLVFSLEEWKPKAEDRITPKKIRSRALKEKPQEPQGAFIGPFVFL